eukprot:1421639-Rhodomonas_salina.2
MDRGGFRLELDFAPNKFLKSQTLSKAAPRTLSFPTQLFSLLPEYWLNEEDSDVLELPVGCDMQWNPGPPLFSSSSSPPPLLLS